MPIYETTLDDNNLLPIEIFIQDTLNNTLLVPGHYHECFEILHMLSGEATQFINGHTYQIHTGDTLLIKSGDIHKTYAPTCPRTQIFVLKFMPSMIDTRYSSLVYFKYFTSFFNFNLNSPIAHLDSVSQEYFSKLLNSISKEYTLKNTGYDLYLRGYLLEVLGFLVRQNLISIPSQLSNIYNNHNLSLVIKYIEENYFLDLSLTDIATLLNMNYSYVSRYFKKITGKTFKQFLEYVRICEANRQLITTNKSITTIAFDCGFNSIQSFTRTYTKLLGFPPSQLRSKKMLN